MADVPKDLVTEIHKLEALFTVDTEKLKEITDHFVSELAKGTFHPESVGQLHLTKSPGLSVEGGSIVSARERERDYAILIGLTRL